MTSQPSDHLINNHIALCTGPVWLPGSNSAEKFPCLLINWHWHWAYCPSISCIYVGIKQTHMPLKMIYSNFMSRQRWSSGKHRDIAAIICVVHRLASPWCVFFYEIPSAIINYRSNYRAVQASEERRRQHPSRVLWHVPTLSKNWGKKLAVIIKMFR